MWLAGRASTIPAQSISVSVDQRDGEAHGNRTHAKSCRTPFSITFARHKTPLTIFLVNGVKLQGVVTWFDNFCVLLRRDGHSQLVYKHAISTIMPGQPIQLLSSATREGAAETSCARPIRKS